jgi:hypothetical protein
MTIPESMTIGRSNDGRTRGIYVRTTPTSIQWGDILFSKGPLEETQARSWPGIFE